MRLKPWTARTRSGMGYDAVNGRPAPLIDQIRRLLHFWRADDVTRVDGHLEERGLRRQPLFGQVLQALIELAGEGGEERALLERLSNHCALKSFFAANCNQVLQQGIVVTRGRLAAGQ